MSGAEVAFITAVVAAGACVQGTVGFGLGLLAAPLLALHDTAFVPGPLLLAGVPLAVLIALQERGALDFGGVRWALVGRVPGTVLGATAVAMLPEGRLVVVIAVAVLMGVGVSLVGWRLAPTTVALLTAGAASGFMGTVTSAGGSPIALVYQERRGPELRATMAAYIVVAAGLSLTALGLAGELGADELGKGLLLMPGTLAGWWVSRAVSRVLDRGYTRLAVLGCAAASALVLLLREVL